MNRAERRVLERKLEAIKNVVFKITYDGGTHAERLKDFTGDLKELCKEDLNVEPLKKFIAIEEDFTKDLKDAIKMLRSIK